MPKTTKKNFDFNKKFSELEKITENLETNDGDLDKSITQFEKGLKLATELKKRLSEVENTIATLKKKHKA